MPVKSPAQFRFMKAAEKGKIASAAAPSPQVAREFLKKTSKKKKSIFAKSGK